MPAPIGVAMARRSSLLEADAAVAEGRALVGVVRVDDDGPVVVDPVRRVDQ
jgi:hypothetical protein